MENKFGLPILLLVRQSVLTAVGSLSYGVDRKWEAVLGLITGGMSMGKISIVRGAGNCDSFSIQEVGGSIKQPHGKVKLTRRGTSHRFCKCR